jgi:hypothetical protein
MSSYEDTQPTQILPPIIVRISDYLVTILCATGRLIEVREVVWIAPNRNEYLPKEKKSKKISKMISNRMTEERVFDQGEGIASYEEVEEW